MKLISLMLLAALALGLSSAACAEDALPAPTQFLTDALYEKADAWKDSDLRALAAVMRKAQSGEPVTVAVIGGSITENTISNGKSDGKVPVRRSYAEIFRLWWETRFPQAKITFINAGIGGTDSYLGLHRLRRNVMSKHPDVVLVEFAVNDDGSKSLYKTSYDNLVRRLLQAENPPAVMLLFMGQTNGATAQSVQAAVGKSYGLPMVSYINAINSAMKTGVYSAGVLSGDTVHPSAVGHALTGEMLWRYLNGVYEKKDALDPPAPFDAPPVTADKYLNPLLLSETLMPDKTDGFERGTANVCRYYPRGWINQSGEGEFTVTLSFKNLGLLYMRTIDKKSGRYEVWVDGERAMTVDGNFPNGWGNAITATEVYTSDVSGEHRVTVRAAQGHEGKLILLGFLTSD